MFRSCHRQASGTTVDDVCASFARCEDKGSDAIGAIGIHRDRQSTDDYFQTNLTDDKFLSESVNTTCNLRGGRKEKHQGTSAVSSRHGGDTPNLPNESIDAFLAHERQSSNYRPTRGTPPANASYISFTDGEYIFAPYDGHSEEFQQFDLWSSKFHQGRHCCHKSKKLSSMDSDGDILLLPCDGCSQCSKRSSLTSTETLKGTADPTSRHQSTSQPENSDNTPKSGRLPFDFPSHCVHNKRANSETNRLCSALRKRVLK